MIRGVFRRIRNLWLALFTMINHGGMRPSHEDDVSRHLTGRASDANSESRMGPPPSMGGGPGIF